MPLRSYTLLARLETLSSLVGRLHGPQRNFDDVRRYGLFIRTVGEFKDVYPKDPSRGVISIDGHSAGSESAGDDRVEQPQSRLSRQCSPGQTGGAEESNCSQQDDEDRIKGTLNEGAQENHPGQTDREGSHGDEGLKSDNGGDN